MNLKTLVKNHQQKIVLAVGFVLVTVIGFGLGRMTVSVTETPEIRVEEVFTLPDNYTPNISGIQSEAKIIQEEKCQDKIKGSSSLIYHVPGGAFYDRTTNPLLCFDTEAEAQSAGFRPSTR